MSRISVKDIEVGDSFSSIFLVGSAQLAESKNGPFWRLELKDATGNIEAKIWSPLSQKVEELKTGDFIEIKCKASIFREQMQLTVEALRVIENTDKLNYADFLASSEVAPIVLMNNLEELAQNELTYLPWKNLVKAVLNDPKIRPKLLLAPAAKSVHHAYVGGLLEHTLSVGKLCLKIADHYPELDRQLLLVAAFFHDIGKLEELSGGIANDYTDDGKLLGHIIQGIFMIKPHMEQSGVDKKLASHLEHLILSHHGQLEYGAPKVPLTAEAFALHYADNLDAKLAQVREVFKNINQMQTGDLEQNSNHRQDEITWSPWINLLNRNLCQMPKTPQKIEHEPRNSRQNDEKQGSLFENF